MPQLSPDHVPNPTIAQYMIISRIGAGGLDEVYIAEDTQLRRNVAPRVLPEATAADGRRLRRLEREALAASALNHPNILRSLDLASLRIDSCSLRSSDQLRGSPNVPVRVWSISRAW